MLEVQKVLRNNPNPLEFLKNNYGVEHKFNDAKDLVILDYDQIECEKLKQKKSPVVRECRGLVLDPINDWRVVSKSFNRFFNLDEYPEDFNWGGNITCSAKHDGSLIKISHYMGQLLITTRFSFGEGEVNKSGFTWRDLVLAHIDPTRLNPYMTYVCELCGPHNRVVRDYPPTLYLLSAFYHEVDDSVWEVPLDFVQTESIVSGIPLTEHYKVSSKEDVVALLERLGKEHPDFEGVVLNDGENRVKVKRQEYTALHYILGNGNIATPKYLVPWLMKGEKDEIVAYFPWLKEYAEKYQAEIDRAWKEIDNTWYCFWDEKSQKQFALNVCKSTKFTWPLFEARKYGKEPKEFFTTDYVLKAVFGV